MAVFPNPVFPKGYVPEGRNFTWTGLHTFSAGLKLKSTGTFYAIFDTSALATTDNTYYLPDVDGDTIMTATTLPNYGLINSDPILEYTPLANPGGFRTWSGSKYFQWSTNSSTGTCTFLLNTAGSRWVFADPGSTGALVAVNGRLDATTFNKVTITAPTTSATFTLLDSKTFTVNQTLTLTGVSGKTLTINNSLTLAGTDSTTMTFPNESAEVASRKDVLSIGFLLMGG